MSSSSNLDGMVMMPADPDAADSVQDDQDENGDDEAGAAAVKKPKERFVYHVLKQCEGFEGPVIFLKDADANKFAAQDPECERKRFAIVEDADAYARSLKPKRSKKRKSMVVDDSKSSIMNEIMEQNDQKWDEKYQELKDFALTVGDGDPNLVMQREYKQPKLMSWLSGQRRNYRRYINKEINEDLCQFDRKERFYKLLELGVKLRPDEFQSEWKDMAQKWYELRQEHPELLLTHQSRDPKIQELAQWQNKQIIDYIKMIRRESGHEMYPHRFKQLRAWNFPFPIDIQTPKKTLKTFDDRLQEFLDWKEVNNTPMVPQHTPILGEWVKEQRKEYRKKLAGKKSCMSDERLAKLQAIGFVFRCRAPRKLPGGASDLVQPMVYGVARSVVDAVADGGGSGSNSHQQATVLQHMDPQGQDMLQDQMDDHTAMESQHHSYHV